MRVRLALATLVNNVFINVQADMAAGDRRINIGMHTFLPIVNYSQFILNEYQEIAQEQTHSPKKVPNPIKILHHVGCS